MVFRRPRGQSGRQCVAKYSERAPCRAASSGPPTPPRASAGTVRAELAADLLDLFRGQQPGVAGGARAQVDLADPLQVDGLGVGRVERRAVRDGAVVAEEAGRTVRECRD